jgi:hypothetical protein
MIHERKRYFWIVILKEFHVKYVENNKTCLIFNHDVNEFIEWNQI